MTGGMWKALHLAVAPSSSKAMGRGSNPVSDPSPQLCDLFTFSVLGSGWETQLQLMPLPIIGNVQALGGAEQCGQVAAPWPHPGNSPSPILPGRAAPDSVLVSCPLEGQPASRSQALSQQRGGRHCMGQR